MKSAEPEEPLAPDEAPLLVDDADGVRTLTLNRPSRLNALNHDLVTLLPIELERAACDPTVRTVVLTGAGRGFCAGGDLEAVAARRSNIESSMGNQRASTLLREMGKPTVAAINGVAAGAGFALVAAADLRVAAASARFTAGFGAVGLSGDYGGAYSLLSLVGRERALRFYLTGETWDAETAARYGLVGEVVPDNEFREAVARFAGQLAAGAPLAMARMKAHFLAAEHGDFASVMRMETQAMSDLRSSDDFHEGVAAFRDRRPPQFRGS